MFFSFHLDLILEITKNDVRVEIEATLQDFVTLSFIPEEINYFEPKSSTRVGTTLKTPTTPSKSPTKELAMSSITNSELELWSKEKDLDRSLFPILLPNTPNLGWSKVDKFHVLS